jgi:hypothetical protein
MKQIKPLKFFKFSAPLTQLKEDLDGLFEDKKVKLSLRLSLSFLGLVLILVLVLWTRLPARLPLFYSLPWGEDQLASKSWFLILPLICFLLVVFNLRLAASLIKKEVLLARILIWSTVILSFLIGTTTVRILLIII